MLVYLIVSHTFALSVQWAEISCILKAQFNCESLMLYKSEEVFYRVKVKPICSSAKNITGTTKSLQKPDKPWLHPTGLSIWSKCESISFSYSCFYIQKQLTVKTNATIWYIHGLIRQKLAVALKTCLSEVVSFPHPEGKWFYKVLHFTYTQTTV